MAGSISQSESDRIYKRLQNAARAMLNVAEEVSRLESINTSVDLVTNLDEHSGGNVTKAQAIAIFQGLQSYRAWWQNNTVAAEVGEQDPARRARFDPFLILENL